MAFTQYSAKPKVSYSSISVRVPIKLKQDFYEALEAEGTTPYKFLQDAIKQKISEKAGGKTVSLKFEYNTATDSFDWMELVDNGSKRSVISGLEPQAVEILARSIAEGLKIRSNFKQGRVTSSLSSIASSAKSRPPK